MSTALVIGNSDGISLALKRRLLAAEWTVATTATVGRIWLSR